MIGCFTQSWQARYNMVGIHRFEMACGRSLIWSADCRKSAGWFPRYLASVSCLGRTKCSQIQQISSMGRVDRFEVASGSTDLKSNEERLLLFDGKAFVFRAYYKLLGKVRHGSLKTDEETASNSEWDSILTVFIALREVLRFMELDPSHVAVVFDFQGPTFRHKLFPDYKSNRSPTPDLVLRVVNYLQSALLSMGIKVVEVPGVEADDVIGTIALQAVAAGVKVRIASPDKDFFQLLSPQVRLLRFVPRGSGIVSFGMEDFSKKFPSLQPSQFVDVMALVGDRIDNVPGLEGIGEMTALKLITEYGSVERLLEERKKVTEKRAQASLLQDTGGALLSKQLLKLKLDIPTFAINCTMQDLAFQKPDDGGIRYEALLKALGSYVDPSIAPKLIKRTIDMWSRYKD